MIKRRLSWGVIAQHYRMGYQKRKTSEPTNGERKKRNFPTTTGDLVPRPADGPGAARSALELGLLKGGKERPHSTRGRLRHSARGEKSDRRFGDFKTKAQQRGANQGEEKNHMSEEWKLSLEGEKERRHFDQGARESSSLLAPLGRRSVNSAIKKKNNYKIREV